MKAKGMPKMKKDVNISEADNGYVVSCYDGEKQLRTVHESMDGAMESVKKMMSDKKVKKGDMSPELKEYMHE